jgi:hypothetical protein
MGNTINMPVSLSGEAQRSGINIYPLFADYLRLVAAKACIVFFLNILKNTKT